MCREVFTLGNMHSSSSRDRMPTDLGGRASIRSRHSWLSSNSTVVQSTPSDAYTSCSSLNRCLHLASHGHAFLAHRGQPALLSDCQLQLYIVMQIYSRRCERPLCSSKIYMPCFVRNVFNHCFGLLLKINTEFYMYQELLAAVTPHRAVFVFAVQTQDGIAYSLTTSVKYCSADFGDMPHVMLCSVAQVHSQRAYMQHAIAHLLNCCCSRSLA